MLALLEERDPAVEARLVERQTHATDVLVDVRRALGTGGDDRSWDGILVTPRVGRVIVMAESLAPSGEGVEPINLFDALVAGGGLAAEILDHFEGNIRPAQRAAG